MSKSDDSSAPRSLPSRANLEQLKKQAKDQLAVLRKSDPAAQLTDAQHAIAKQYGFASWRELKIHLDTLNSAAALAVAAVKRGDVVALVALLDAHSQLTHTAAEHRDGELNALPTDAPAMRLLHVAVAANQVDIAGLLLERGADPNARNRHGRTPLHDCIELCHDTIQALLLEHGATIDVCAAAILGKHDRLRELIAADAELANDMSTNLPPLGWAAFGWKGESARILIEHGGVFDRPPYDSLVLGPVASVEAVPVLDVLLEHGLDSNWRFKDGETILHRAIRSRVNESVDDFARSLLAAGYDVNAADADGRTALDLALTMQGQNVEDYAKGNAIGTKSYDDLIALLKECGGKTTPTVSGSASDETSNLFDPGSRYSPQTAKGRPLETEQTYHLSNLAPLLMIYDMPTSIAFYRDVLGFKVVSTDAGSKGDDCDWAMLRRDGATLMLNTAYESHKRPAAPDPQRVRAHDDTGLYFGCKQLDAVYEQLRAHNCNVKPPSVSHYGMRQLYVTDPDGYGLCFQCSAKSAEG